MPRWLLTLLRLTPIVAAASALSVAGLLVFRAVVPLAMLKPSSAEVGNYLQTLGGIYAVLLAFVVYAVWAQFNEARALVDREAAAISDLYRLAGGLPEATRVGVQRGLRAYLGDVIDREWPAMACRDEDTIEQIGEHFDRVWAAIHHCVPTDVRSQTIYGEALGRFDELTTLRTNRLTAARTRVPQAMRILLFSGALITTGSMYLLAIEALWMHALVTAALAGAIAHVLYLIVDLDQAFAGDWQVAKVPFERARKQCDRATVIAQLAVDEC
ncbi:MAG: DUF4239 domain-containing protein [Proteobacteria bacterium]|nr:DUF4239 domain-containing protein [Pseudomonadota bacterium]